MIMLLNRRPSRRYVPFAVLTVVTQLINTVELGYR